MVLRRLPNTHAERLFQTTGHIWKYLLKLKLRKDNPIHETRDMKTQPTGQETQRDMSSTQAMGESHQSKNRTLLGMYHAQTAGLNSHYLHGLEFILQPQAKQFKKKKQSYTGKTLGPVRGRWQTSLQVCSHNAGQIKPFLKMHHSKNSQTTRENEPR